MSKYHINHDTSASHLGDQQNKRDSDLDEEMQFFADMKKQL